MTLESNIKAPHRKKFGSWQVYLGLLISMLCFWWVFASVEQEEVFQRVKNVRAGYLLVAVALTFLSYFLRALRWPYFFAKNAPNLRDSFSCLIIGFFMNNVLPARFGELVRAHLGGKATKQSRSTVLASIAGERLADGLMISLFFAVLFSLSPVAAVSEKGVGELFLVSYLFLFAAVMTVILLFCREKLFSLLERLAQIMPGNLSSYTLARVRYFIEGLAPLLQLRKLAALLPLSVIVWSVELLAYHMVALAFEHPLTLGGLSLFLAAVNFSSLVPAAPAGAGVIEVFGTLALVRIGVDRETALAMVAGQHIIQFCVVGLPGVVLFFSRLGGKIPESEEDEEIEQQLAQGIEAVGEEFRDVSEPRPEPMEVEEDFGFVPGKGGSGKSVGEKKNIELSIIVPAFNEEFRLAKTLLEILEYFRAKKTEYEVLVVDDGSIDQTSKVVLQFEHLNSAFRLLTYGRNRGKGYAVRYGMANARGKLQLFCDADGATPIAEIERLEHAIEQGAQVAIGSRAMYSRETQVSAVWYRKIMGRTFNGLVNLLLLPGVADTQCGFKMFTKEAAQEIFPRQKAERFSFDVEILFLARKLGFRIAEVPVNWTNIPGSKVDLVKDSAAMFLDLLKFRLRDALGAYGRIAKKVK